jgi:hypothetical protein
LIVVMTICVLSYGTVVSGQLTQAASDGPLPPQARSGWTIDSQQDWVAAALNSAEFEVVNGTAIPTNHNAIFTSRIQRFTEKQHFTKVTFKQTPHWGARKWSDAGNLAPIPDGDAAVFLSPAAGDYWYFNALKGGGTYHAWHSTDMKEWRPYGNVIGKDWVTSAEYADGKFFIYYDEPNDEDPHLIVYDTAENLASGKGTECRSVPWI